MIDYLLKSGACLLVFYAFYVLLLEKENMHVYKRVYLLATIAISFIIPFVTFTNYVAVVEQLTPVVLAQSPVVIPVIDEVESVSYMPMILWGIYGLGVLFFSMKFIKNIYEIIIKVKNNPKKKYGSTTSVFLEEDIVPHTFLNFIFLNKMKFKTHQIPKEVILHEQAHADQKHSVDVLLIEFVQVVFWFNPLVYLLKRAIKLNHEFLADQAVLNQGANAKKYQKTLLAFSSNAYQLPLANAINYSSIKKRFTVMRTKTSKKTIWLRSFVALPILALLLYSFSTTVQQEKASPKQVAEYNVLAKKYNEQSKSMVVKLKEVNRLEYLHKLMNSAQKEKAEKLPTFPPMPPVPKTTMRVTKNFYTFTNDKGEEVKVEMQYDGHKDFIAVPPPPPIPENATEKEKQEYADVIKKYKKRVEAEKRMLDEQDKYIATFKDNNGQDVSREFWLDEIDEKTPSNSEMRKRMIEKGAKFYFDKKSISKKEAVAIVEKYSKINLFLDKDILHLSTEPIGSKEKERPITLVNGKTPCEGCVLELTKEKLAAIVLSVDKGTIAKFLIKFRGKPTITIKNSNVLNEQAKELLENATVGQMVQIFGLKSSESDLKSAPVLFEIVTNPKSNTPLPKEANYILDNKKVSYDEASKISNDKIQSVDVADKDENGNKLEKPFIYIYTKKEKKKVDESKRPVTLINGKRPCEGCVLELTKEQLSRVLVTVEKGSVAEFKIKFPGKPTVTVSDSNTLNKEAKVFLQEAKVGQRTQIFGLKSSESDLKSAPVLFKIIE